MSHKKTTLFFLLFLSIIFLIFPHHSFAAEWTFMVYLDGDNNLEGAGVDDINEMETVGSTDDVNIVVQFDRIEGYDASNGDWHDTRRGMIIKDSTSQIVSNLVSIGEKNMGDPDVLREFVSWGMSNFPANHYLLVFWNHGDGWHTRIEQYQQELQMVNEKILREGPSLKLQQENFLLSKKIAEATKAICWDDTDGGDALTIAECRQALEGVNNKVDIIGFDACLMAMVEVAQEIEGVGNIMVASEQLEPDDGWPYDLILADLVANPSRSPTQLSQMVVSSYGYSYGGEETQSAILLSKIPILSGQIDSLASILLSETTDWETIQEARNAASYFYEPDYRDLKGFLDGLIVSAENETIKDAAIQTRTALLNAVIENHSGPNEEANGLSIQLIGLGGDFPYGYNESSLLFAKATRWDEFLEVLSQQQPPDDDYEENDTINEAWPLDMGEYQSLCCQDDDWFEVVVASNSPLMVTISFSHSAGDLDLKLYDRDLNLVDLSESTGDTESVYAKAGTSEKYFIQIYGYNGATNHYDLTISSPVPDNFYAYELIPYEWIDVTDGTFIQMGDDDYTSVQIGFDFQFYGINYSGVKISSNGYLTFGYVGQEYENQPIPVPGEPSNLIAPFWDDLVPSNGDGVFYKIIGTAPNRKLVVQWDNVPHYYTTEGITFEAILEESSNEIVFQYKDVNFNDPDYDKGKSATVGIENSSGTMGTLYSYKTLSLSDQRALRFFIPPPNVNITEVSIESEHFLAQYPINFVTTAVSQGGPLYYQYWIAPGYGTPEYGTAWNCIRDFYADNTCTWTPTNEDRYVAVVHVTDDTSLPVNRQAFAGMSIPVGCLNDHPHITSLKADISPTPLSPGIVMFTAEANGGSVPYYFQYWVAQNDRQVKTWSIIQDFSTSGTCQWIPDEPGSYVVVVYVSETPGIEETPPELAGLTLVLK